jgi:hypothetical protein
VASTALILVTPYVTATVLMIRTGPKTSTAKASCTGPAPWSALGPISSAVARANMAVGIGLGDLPADAGQRHGATVDAWWKGAVGATEG